MPIGTVPFREDGTRSDSFAPSNTILDKLKEDSPEGDEFRDALLTYIQSGEGSQAENRVALLKLISSGEGELKERGVRDPMSPSEILGHLRSGEAAAQGPMAPSEVLEYLRSRSEEETLPTKWKGAGGYSYEDTGDAILITNSEGKTTPLRKDTQDPQALRALESIQAERSTGESLWKPSEAPKTPAPAPAPPKETAPRVEPTDVETPDFVSSKVKQREPSDAEKADLEADLEDPTVSARKKGKGIAARIRKAASRRWAKN